jgi:hypothetical protein
MILVRVHRNACSPFPTRLAHIHSENHAALVTSLITFDLALRVTVRRASSSSLRTSRSVENSSHLPHENAIAESTRACACASEGSRLKKGSR